jgi:hypothetical protein
MKTLAALLTVLGFFTTSAGFASIENDAQRKILVACENQDLQVRVYSTENLKDAQLIVANLSSETPSIMYNEIVRPLDTDEQNMQLYISDTASLRVVSTADGMGMKGFLNLRTDEPGVGQVLNCEMYYHILNPK